MSGTDEHHTEDDGTGIVGFGRIRRSDRDGANAGGRRHQ
jgi:hypothetical protein